MFNGDEIGRFLIRSIIIGTLLTLTVGILIGGVLGYLLGGH